ncbi:MAG: hypothetical protein Q4A61_06730 [Porphyromonadaceae bacterium]|nr:hypothetical protein [Porphyromonadaceae bacterium]MDO4707307.1 hypothetical protein [Porphyromonadaceae bacterium]MDO4708090.1 hypothetical protein [Porphyromonadaceae bacterium]
MERKEVYSSPSIWELPHCQGLSLLFSLSAEAGVQDWGDMDSSVIDWGSGGSSGVNGWGDGGGSSVNGWGSGGSL